MVGETLEVKRQLDLCDLYPSSFPKEKKVSRFEDSESGGEAWQYKMRELFAKEESDMPYWENYDLDIKKSTVEEIPVSVAKRVIDKYEWLGCMPVGVKKCYGLYFPSKNDNTRILGGVTVFSKEYAENTGVWEKYGFNGEIILLARGVNLHFCPKNANSHLIMESIKMLPEEYKVITCTVDPLAGEVGTIYQSCNFYYVGVMRRCKERIGCIIGDKLYGSRALRQKFGTQKKEVILEKCPEARFIKQKSKGRYFYFRGDKRIKRDNLKKISHMIKPYPKR